MKQDDMNLNEITEKIQTYIIKESFADEADIHYDTLIFESNLLDSMGFLFLIEYLREQFNIEVQDDELINDNFKSINSISEFIFVKLNNFSKQVSIN